MNEETGVRQKVSIRGDPYVQNEHTVIQVGTVVNALQVSKRVSNIFVLLLIFQDFSFNFASTVNTF